MVAKNTGKKTYNELLYSYDDLPKIRVVGSQEKIKKTGGSRFIIAPPTDYDERMKAVPKGKITTEENIKQYLAKKYSADNACPVSTRKLVLLAAFASVERPDDKTPYWRTLKKDGRLNEKYPGGIDEQKRLLELEGHTIIQVGGHYYVKDYMAVAEYMRSDPTTCLIQKSPKINARNHGTCITACSL